MTENTEEIQPVDGEEEKEENSLIDDLAAAFEEAEKATEAEENSENKENKTAEEAPEEASNKEAENEPSDIEKTDTDEVSNRVEAPQHWSAKDRDEFGKIPGEYQSLIMRRHKEMEADYTRKTQDIAEVRRNWDVIAKEFEPFKQILTMNGTDEVATIKRYIAIDKSLNTNPLATIKWLAGQYNVDLGSFKDESGESYIDPDTRQLREQNQQLVGRINQIEAKFQQKDSLSVHDQIKAFEEERDSAGNLKYPHFQDVRHHMSVLFGNGNIKTLAEAYESAVWASKDTRQKLLQAENRAKLSKQNEMDKQKAVQAKKAASSNPSGSSLIKRKKEAELSLYEELEAAADELGASF